MQRTLQIGLLLAGVLHAGLVWDFAKPDTRPDAINGAYAYLYPEPATKQSPRHTASMAWEALPSGGGQVVLSYVLDGDKFPSAGVGLKFPSAQALDLNGFQGIRVSLQSSIARTVRVSLGSRLKGYQEAADTGMSYGFDLQVGPKGVDTLVNARSFFYPWWAVDHPDILEKDLLASVWAIQLNVSCDSASCSKDTGHLVVRRVSVEGVDGRWPEPPTGNCSGEAVPFSKFTGKTANFNTLGGRWYAYNDRTADSASQSRGKSQILGIPDTTDKTSWFPDTVNQEADLQFRLDRVQPYSGYVAIESEFGPASAAPVRLPGTTALSFQLKYDANFPSDVNFLGGVILRVRKSGAPYLNGKEHQIRIPWTSASRNWCIDFTSLHQPTWSSTDFSFTPDSLSTITWAVQLAGEADQATGGFHLSNVQFWKAPVTVLPKPDSRYGIRRTAAGWEFARGSAETALELVLVDVQGHRLGGWSLEPGQRTLSLGGFGSRARWLRVGQAGTWRTLSVPPGF